LRRNSINSPNLSPHQAATATAEVATATVVAARFPATADRPTTASAFADLSAALFAQWRCARRQ